MRAYLVTTSILFALLVVAHVWRIVAESHALAANPSFLLITAVAAAFSAWGVVLLRRLPSR